MARPSFLSQPIVQRLPNLLKEVQEGGVLIPQFQRPFVWNVDQRLLLLRSIYQGMPIGSILVWRTRSGTHDLNCYSQLGPIPLQLGASNGSSKDRQYLLDGHQRLTTLYVALGEGLLEAEDAGVATNSQLADEKADDWPVYFDLKEREFVPPRKRGTSPRHWLPLSILFDPFKLYEFQKLLVEEEGDRILMNRAEALASAFKDYCIPVVPIVTDDLELVTESFQRINSAGTRMDQVHMVSALVWRSDFDLNERIEGIREGLGAVGWQDLEARMILNTCKAALGLDIYEAEAKAIQAALVKSPGVLDEAAENIKAAADFLREDCGVYGRWSLPYSYQIVFLAEALNCSQGPLSEELRENLRHWFWTTTYGEYFAGGSYSRHRRALDQLRLVAAGGADWRPPGVVSRITSPLRFNIRSARTKALALRLAELGPIDPAGSENPGQLLADHGGNAMAVIVPSSEIARASERPENRVLVHPRHTLALRQALRAERADGDTQLLASHAIDEEAAEALVAADYDRFLSLRRQRLIRIEKGFVEKLGFEYEAPKMPENLPEAQKDRGAAPEKPRSCAPENR